jgi:hypothetical protein
MQMLPLSSSNIAGAGYDADTRTMRVSFHSGRTYEYIMVDPATFQGLIDSPSVGKYFNALIRPVYQGYEV